MGMAGGFGLLGSFYLALTNCPSHKSNESVCRRLVDSEKAPLLAICIHCSAYASRRKRGTHSIKKGSQQTSSPEPLKSGDGFMQKKVLFSKKKKRGG